MAIPVLSSSEIRQSFLDFFAQRGHTVVPSASLIPHNDPSLLFVNSGMVPFKNYFLGKDKPPFNCAVSSQKCIRAGGKHNDLDNVGFTARHHTFFEMLGNFSFGDYFKQQAIQYGWGFLTQILKLPETKLWVTVYQDDDESYAIWRDEIGVSEHKIIRLGKASNFWQMAATGPCGPCSEVFYDHGESVFGGPPGSATEDGDRFVEIWNMVFMQYNQQEDGSLDLLPHPCVDTGMGLERVTSVLQGVHDNYQTDAFSGLMQAIDQMPCDGDTQSNKCDPVITKKVISDHIRSSVFLVSEGVLPDNEGANYVLRRIIRRALRFGYMMGLPKLFFADLVPIVISNMQLAYPNLAKQADHIQSILAKETHMFSATLESGIKLLEQHFANSTNNGDKQIASDLVFKLYDTYGFPSDLTAIIAAENGYSVDLAGYEMLMAKQKQRSKSNTKFADVTRLLPNIDLVSQFTGYRQDTQSANIIGLFNDEGTPVLHLTDAAGVVVLDGTPFYAESGGQVADKGIIANTENGSFAVADVQKQGSAILHFGQAQGCLKLGDKTSARYAQEQRLCIAANHSATHLLHTALAQVLGDHVEQKGSLVDADKLRFDFAHDQPLTAQQKERISQIVNGQIQSAVKVNTQQMPYQQAISAGAKALFSEKYGDEVRVVSMGTTSDTHDFSVELCGGTHVERLSDIGYFYVTSESGLAAGVRRIEAVTGVAALRLLELVDKQIKQLKDKLQVHTIADIDKKLDQLLELNAELNQKITQISKQEALGQVDQILAQVTNIGKVQVVVSQVHMSRKNALEVMDRLRNKLPVAVILLVAVEDTSAQLLVSVSQPLFDQVTAKDLVAFAAMQIGGKGGGKNDRAQGGGNDIAKIPAMLIACNTWLANKLL